MRWIALLASLLLLASATGAQAAIYWANQDSISRANSDGSSPSYFVSTPWERQIYGGCGVAVDGSHIYWGDAGRGSIGRANLDGSDPNYVFIPGANSPCGVAVDGRYIYWANRGKSSVVGPEVGSIGRANLDGSGIEQGFVPDVPGACGVASDGSHLFWGSFWKEEVGRANLDGSSVERAFIAASNGACGVAVNRTHVFWGSYGRSIGRASIDGTTVEPTFISGLERPCGIAVDETHVYWTEEASSRSIGIANLDGSSVNRALFTNQNLPCGIAVDSRVATIPAVPPPSPSRLSLAKVKHSKRKWAAYLAVDVVGWGPLRVELEPGLTHRDLGPAKDFSGEGGRHWLRIWAKADDGHGERLRKQLRREGRVRTVVTVHYAALGGTETTKTKRLSLLP